MFQYLCQTFVPNNSPKTGFKQFAIAMPNQPGTTKDKEVYRKKCKVL
jgi:hypothetical protein